VRVTRERGRRTPKAAWARRESHWEKAKGGISPKGYLPNAATWTLCGCGISVPKSNLLGHYTQGQGYTLRVTSGEVERSGIYNKISMNRSTMKGMILP